MLRPCRVNARHTETKGLETPITRDDFERAVRYLHLSDLDQRDMLLRLAAQVVARAGTRAASTEKVALRHGPCSPLHRRIP